MDHVGKKNTKTKEIKKVTTIKNRKEVKTRNNKSTTARVVIIGDDIVDRKTMHTDNIEESMIKIKTAIKMREFNSIMEGGILIETRMLTSNSLDTQSYSLL